MKFSLSCLFPPACSGALALALALMQPAAATTTLIFDGASAAPLSLNGSGQTLIPNSFGDSAAVSSQGLTASAGSAVTGTPSIDLTWNTSGRTDLYDNWDARGSVAQLDFGATGQNGNTIQWTFTPGASDAVRIVSFALDLWAGGGDTRVDWTLSGPLSGTLNTASWLRNNTGGRDAFPVNATGQAGESLTLSFTRLSGLGNYVALDNLVIDQIPVPEPAGAVLGLLGLTTAALRRRRSA